MLDLMRRETGRAESTRARSMVGIVDAYDPNEHAVKVKFLTEVDDDGKPRISGWLRIRTAAGGATGSLVIGPTVGDQAVVEHHEGDAEGGHVTGFLHNDTDRPPNAASGAGVLKVSSFTIVCGGVTFAISSSGVAITGGTLTHNGKNIGDTHTHSGVTTGGGNTGAPV
jgi:hypothetical protein